MLLDGRGRYLAAMKGEESLKGKDDDRNAAAVVLCSGRGAFTGLRDFCNRLRYSFRLVLQGQISLSNDSDDALLSVNDRHAPDLMFLHQALTILDVFSFAASDRIQRHELLNRDTLRIQAVGDYRTAQVPVCDHPDELGMEPTL